MYSFQEIKENLEINPATLRNWCKRFDITPDKNGGDRLYSKESFETLMKIKSLRSKNYSYDEILSFLSEKSSPYQDLMRAIQRLESGHQISIFDVLPELV